MTSCAAQRPRIVIVHFSHQQPAAPITETRWRDARVPELGRVELELLGILHLSAQGVELDLERRNVREDEAEEHEPEIAVDGTRPRCVLERARADRLLDCLSSL